MKQIEFPNLLPYGFDTQGNDKLHHNNPDRKVMAVH